MVQEYTYVHDLLRSSEEAEWPMRLAGLRLNRIRAGAASDGRNALGCFNAPDVDIREALGRRLVYRLVRTSVIVSDSLRQYRDDFFIMAAGQVLELLGVEAIKDAPQLPLHPRLSHDFDIRLEQSGAPSSLRRAPYLKKSYHFHKNQNLKFNYRFNRIKHTARNWKKEKLAAEFLEELLHAPGEMGPMVVHDDDCP